MAARKGRPPTTKGMVLAKSREDEALTLRMAGHNYRSIADKLGMSHEGVRDCVRRAMERLQAVCDEKAEELRRIEVERLDALQVACWPTAVGGDLAAIKQAASLIQQRCDLLGLQAKDEVQAHDGNYTLTIPVAGGVSLTLAPGQPPPEATATAHGVAHGPKDTEP